MTEGRVYVCCWDEDGGRWRLWVKSAPRVFGEGATYDEAEEQLLDAIASWNGDCVAVFEFDSPLPLSSNAGQFSKPSLVLIIGDSFPDSFGPKETLFTGGRCRPCQMGIGDRSEVPLWLGPMESGFEGGFLYCGNAVTRYYFSESFLSLLNSDERADFEFRKVERVDRARKRFFELVARPRIPFVGVRGMDASGFECPSCGGRTFSFLEPNLPFGAFVCRSDLPDPLPAVFAVGSLHTPHLCMTQERWSELVGSRKARGIVSHPLGVVDPTDCDRHPRLTRHWNAPCRLCSDHPWFIPNSEEILFQRRRIVRWVIDAANAGDIVFVRKPVELEALFDLLDPPKPVEHPIVFSYRCPECWKLGRIIFNKTDVQFCNWD